MATAPPLEDLITCSVCLEIYRDPHCLACLHTYCLPCIKQLEQKSKVVCPECRKQTEISNIQKEFKVQSLIDFHTRANADVTSVGHPPCEICHKEGNTETSGCRDCGQLVCIDCGSAHKEICQRERFQLLSQNIKSLQARFRGNLSEVKEADMKIVKKSEDVDKAIEQIQAKEVGQLKELEKYKEQMIEKIEQHHRQLQENVHSANEERIKYLNRGKQLFQQMRVDLKSTEGFLCDMMESEDIATLMDGVKILETDTKKKIGDVKAGLAAVKCSTETIVDVQSGESFDPAKYIKVTADKIEDIQAKQAAKSYANLCNKYFMPSKQVDLRGTYYSRRLQMINDTIWCAKHNDGIQVYNKECEITQAINHQKLRPCVGVAQTYTGDIIVASYKNGLHQLDIFGQYLGCIMDGTFSDVCSYGEMIYALDCANAQILPFEYVQDKWSDMKPIGFHYKNANIWDKIHASSSGIYVSSYKNHCLYVYNLDGNFLFKMGEDGFGDAGKFNGPVLCDVDNSGNVLVCDYSHHRLQVYNKANGKWSVVTINGSITEPCDAIVDPDGGNMWIVTRYNKLIKYSNSKK